MASQVNNGGALYELVARGVKDSYFFADSADSSNAFSWKYEKYPAVQTETRHARPINAAGFGRTVLIDIDQYADILQSASIHVKLPSWIPELYKSYSAKGLVHDASGTTYGYCPGIAYVLFKKIEVLQDNIILQEVTGDALYVASRHSGSWNRHHLMDELAGIYTIDDSLAMQRSADPDRTYIIPLPFIDDFPLVAVRGQRFRVRLTLRDLEEVVVCSNIAVPRPAPWSLPQFTYQTGTGSGTFAPLKRYEMEEPIISLELVQTYLSNTDRDQLAKASYVIPYRRYQSHNTFNFGPATYAPLPAVNPSTAKNYDGILFIDRILSCMRSARSVQAGRLTTYNNVTVSGENYIQTLQSAYGSTIRDDAWTPLVLNKLVQHAHETYTSAIQLMMQDYGFSAPPLSKTYEPPAGLNYSEAVEPNIRVVLEDIEPDFYNGQKISILDMVLCGTAFYAVESGRGGLAFAN